VGVRNSGITSSEFERMVEESEVGDRELET
jgi:hypothetical protein